MLKNFRVCDHGHRLTSTFLTRWERLGPHTLRKAVSYTDYPTIQRAELLTDHARPRKSQAHRNTWSMGMVSDPIKILIVDDDERVLIELERLLESEGYCTTTAWSVSEAMALSDQAEFDILLVDADLVHPESEQLFAELERRQPNARCLPMHTRKGPRAHSAHAVCKWEHAEMKATIRNFLAA
jgi:PleD family two-component response regulator